MDLEQIRQILERVLKLRVPRFTDDVGPRERANRMGDYLMESAYANGDLIEARHALREAERHLADLLRKLEGWEAMLRIVGNTSGRPTKTQVSEAKRLTAPHIFDAHAEARLLRGSVDDQIERLKFEAQFVISRAYTIISGN